MARGRSKKRKATGHRRRRVGALNPTIMNTAAAVFGAGIGAVVGVFANQAIKTSFTTAPSWAGGGLCAAAGAAIPIVMRNPGPVLTGLSFGLAGVGMVFVMNETFLSLPGISGMPMANAPIVKKGYVSSAVAGRGTPMKRSVGNMSGNKQLVVAGIMDN